MALEKLATWLGDRIVKTTIQLPDVLVIDLATFGAFESLRQGYLAVFWFHGSFYKPVIHPPPLYGGICDIDCAHLKTI